MLPRHASLTLAGAAVWLAGSGGAADAQDVNELLQRNRELMRPYFECTAQHPREMRVFARASEIRQLLEIKARFSVETVDVAEPPCKPPETIPTESTPPVMIQMRKNFSIQTPSPPAAQPAPAR